MKKRQLTEEQAAEIFKDRFSPGTTPRSLAYQLGFQENLRRHSFPNSDERVCPYKSGSEGFDAYYAGFASADNSMECFWYRQEDVGVPA